MWLMNCAWERKILQIMLSEPKKVRKAMMKGLRAKGEIKRDIKPKMSKEKVKLKDTAKITAIAYTKGTFEDEKI